MLLVSRSASEFIARNLSLKLLAYAFLLLIGLVLLCDAAGTPIPKVYLYTAMAFAVLVERLNVLLRRGTS
jgi:predicted tellurium resistance membrane protein TerC